MSDNLANWQVSITVDGYAYKSTLLTHAQALKWTEQIRDAVMNTNDTGSVQFNLHVPITMREQAVTTNYVIIPIHVLRRATIYFSDGVGDY